MTRVCFLTHNLKQDNGAGVFSLCLINGLKENYGVEPTVFIHPISFFKLWRAIKKCDIVHALDVWPYAVLGYLASRGLRKKFIITAVGSGALLPLYDWRHVWITKRAYRAADKVTAVSNFTKQEILKKVPGLEIKVITHGVDFEKFQKTNQLRANESFRFSHSPGALAQGGAAALFPINRGTMPAPRAKPAQQLIGSLRPYILSVGTIRWRKGYHRSIPAFAKVSVQFPDLKYIIVGKRFKDDYDARLKKMIGDLKLEDKIIIFDHLDNGDSLVKLYQNAELFCLMSQTANRDLEGFGLVFLEAAAAGLPVVGTNGSGTEDAVMHGKNGFLVDPLDIDGFANAIVGILKDPNTKTHMSKVSLEFAKNSTWEKRIREYATLYKNLG